MYVSDACSWRHVQILGEFGSRVKERVFSMRFLTVGAGFLRMRFLTVGVGYIVQGIGCREYCSGHRLEGVLFG